jgi:hypothetical protein
VLYTGERKDSCGLAVTGIPCALTRSMNGVILMGKVRILVALSRRYEGVEY